ncbi:unnamed protein product [Anisakis simplex]|uniref:DOMON domain-containing protein n=1 Tax=Anisakis simplex TaxID=6269 RepID=A0A0M3JYT5_ANISI|nr:unnamed protein product [Anisakis simplex]
MITLTETPITVVNTYLLSGWAGGTEIVTNKVKWNIVRSLGVNVDHQIVQSNEWSKQSENENGESAVFLKTSLDGDRSIVNVDKPASLIHQPKTNTVFIEPLMTTATAFTSVAGTPTANSTITTALTGNNNSNKINDRNYNTQTKSNTTAEDAKSNHYIITSNTQKSTKLTSPSTTAQLIRSTETYTDTFPQASTIQPTTAHQVNTLSKMAEKQLPSQQMKYIDEINHKDDTSAEINTDEQHPTIQQQLHISSTSRAFGDDQWQSSETMQHAINQQPLLPTPTRIYPQPNITGAYLDRLI